MVTIHIAGHVEQDVQKCSRCGRVLIDCSDEAVMVASDETPMFRFWEHGSFVATFPGGAGLRANDNVGMNERRCVELVN